MLTLILIILIVIAAIVVFSIVVFFGRGLMLGGMLAWIGGRWLLRKASGNEPSAAPNRAEVRDARVREENRRMIAGEGSLRQVRLAMKAEARAQRPSAR